MISLDRNQRSALVVAAVLCFIGAFAGTPLHARGALSDGAPIRTAGESASSPFIPLVVIAVQRDPFSGNDETETRAERLIPPLPVGVLPQLPNNLTGGSIPGIPIPGQESISNGVRVEAVMIGPHPFAMISQGSSNQIVSIGERVSGQRIRTITIDGVHFFNGRFMPVAAAKDIPDHFTLPLPGGPLP